MIRKIVAAYRRSARNRRKLIFANSFNIDQKTKILDLGSESGAAIHAVLDGLQYSPKNVFIADIDESVIKQGGGDIWIHPCTYS